MTCLYFDSSTLLDRKTFVDCRTMQISNYISERSEARGLSITGWQHETQRCRVVAWWCADLWL